MNKMSRTITGLIFIVGSVALIISAFFYNAIDYVSIFFGLGIFILGIFIFFNKYEDKIERARG